MKKLEVKSEEEKGKTEADLGITARYAQPFLF